MKETAGSADNASNPLFSGELPLSYGDAALEYRAFYEGAAVYDEGRRGKIRAVGADVLDLLNRLSTNKVDHLAAGEGAPTVFTSDKGRIIDLVYVLNLGPFVLMLTGAGAQGRVMEWIDRYTIMEDSTMEDVTDSLELVSLAGPNGLRCVWRPLRGLRFVGLENFHSMRLETDAVGWMGGTDGLGGAFLVFKCCWKVVGEWSCEKSCKIGAQRPWVLEAWDAVSRWATVCRCTGKSWTKVAILWRRD